MGGGVKSVALETVETEAGEVRQQKTHAACNGASARAPDCLCGKAQVVVTFHSDDDPECVLCNFIYQQDAEDGRLFPCRSCGTVCWWEFASPFDFGTELI